MDEGWRTFDHTGDLGLEVRAAGPERLFALAAIALLAQVVEAPRSTREGAPEVSVTLELEGEDPADLLVHWLNTALLEAEVRRAVWTRAVVELPGPGRLRGTLEGPRRDAARHTFLREVKAVSHHGLELALDPGACRCRLVLDI
uniref:Archease n=1 Tax=Eiseniibacteriota bacterium TaxID=2212470 RepID=A0A832I1A5_UNCEI